ncbi:MAG: adenylate/guanylate cyclase domain-containing protein [Alphaproteobacteria bacterium]|nr:adenylate/guanylate cyclase domain-containing protein [Alphaproteobacteria bacterium]MBV9154228.1 adenylate/guanylate cyclase domain-containing protein [Alphaproteobacteria bacterium]MBV9583728.1 adenylate/guanylate cyclase domain-containing protein [Alphaproteobacteria bacterium]
MQRFRRYLYRQLHHLVPLPILLAAFVAWFAEPGALVQFRLDVFDEYLRLKPRQYEPTPVRIVDIDEDSLARLGQWPWPRTLLARLVDRLNEMGAAAVAFDINFNDPDRTTPSRIIEHTPGLEPDDPLVARFKAMPDHDQVFADAIKRRHVVLGFALRDEERGRLPAPKASYSSLGDNPRPWVPHFRGAADNLPELEAAAAGNAAFVILPERDGISRRAPLIVAIGDQLYPALAIDTLRVAQGAPGYLVKSTGASGVMSFGEHTGLNAIKVGNLVVPTDNDGTVWVHFTPHQPERFLSAWKILDGTADPELVKDNIVLIGVTAEGLKDVWPTPLDPGASGVEIHAQLIEQMLLGDVVKRPDWARGAEVLFMLYIGIGLLLLLPRVGARWTALLGLTAITPAVCASWYAYSWYGLLLDPVFPSLVGVLVYLSSSAVLFFRTETERRQVRHAFSRYLAPAVVEHLAEHPERLTLGGELRELTIMFSDIRGFTTISEGMDARELTSFLNRYLTPMTDVIMSHDGTVDKYMADGIMAFWNAPLEDARHAEHACLAALAMRTELARLNDAWRAEASAAGRPFREVRAGIGLNTGECVVGNLGSDQRFDYSVLGDDANVASRLEGQTKTYHVDIIVGERTALQVSQFAMLELDLIQVVGKTKPVRIFFLLGDEGVRATSAFASLESAHDAMIRAYRRRDWRTALNELDSCRAQAPEIVQYVYQLYEARIADLQASPPPPDWDGVYAALMK